MLDIKTIADRADVIVNGYAFERKEDGIHVLNLNHPDKASVFNNDDEDEVPTVQNSIWDR